MPHPSRIFPSDEERGKRDDDLKPALTNSWRPLRWRRRRIAVGLVAVLLVYAFIHTFPTDLASNRPMHPRVQFGYVPPPYQPEKVETSRSTKGPTGPPPKDQDASHPEEDHYYWGPIRFYNLASSLHKVSRYRTRAQTSRNVLFAASSMKSAANILPLACQMHTAGRNSVHFVIMGRDNLPLDDLLDINGIDRARCNIGFHDGRPDYSEYSSDARAEVSVSGALGHIEQFMNPRVFITDDSMVEDLFFTKGLRTKAAELDRPIIEIPSGKYEDFVWMTRLDYHSLEAWHKPSINILVHATPHTSGSLVRLFDSLSHADYSGLVPPQLTVELPADIEPSAGKHLREMVWPPMSIKQAGVPHHNNIIVQHRLSSVQATVESSATRLMEAFYPADPEHSHVLLLSSQTELSPMYYQFLLYHILEYRYSATPSLIGQDLLGFALSIPQSQLDGQRSFKIPSVSEMTDAKYRQSDEVMGEEAWTAPFLWQAPNADAVLIFGDKWAEFHDYMKLRLRTEHSTAAVHNAPVRSTKLIAETQPGWMEFLLELMRARGWTVLYPASRAGAGIATVHKELYQPPEEFVKPSQAKVTTLENEGETTLPDPSEPFLSVDYSTPVDATREGQNLAQRAHPLDTMLPFNGELPNLIDMPHITHLGEIVPSHVLQNMLFKYKETMREQVGGCTAKQAKLTRPREVGKAEDLFCFLDQDFDNDEKDSVGEESAPLVDLKDADDVAGIIEKDADAPAIPMLDSTAKQKQAHAQAFKLSADAPVVAEAGTVKAPLMVEDLGPVIKKEGTPDSRYDI